jgi:chromosome segregation protein
MEANLTRVADLTGEIRRQLGPLGRQAEAARKAAVIQAEARDARLRLLADDLVQLTSTLEQEVADETALIARRSTLEQTLTDLRSRLTLLEDESAAAAPLLAQAHDRWGRFQSLRDRLDSTGGIARERMRLLGQDDADETTTGRDPEELRAQAAQARENEAALLAEVAAALDELKAAVSLREDSEKAYAAEQARLSSLARAAADRREGLAKLAGQVGARRSRIEAREAEIGRLEGIVAASLARAAEAEKEFAALESTVADDEEGEVGLDGTYEVAEAQLADLEGEIETLLAAERDADRDRASAKARLEALELSLRRRDGAAALLAAADDQRAEHGIVGAVSTLLTITGGHEHAVAAALGWASEALAVGSSAQAASALDRLRSEDAGQAAMLVADTARRIDPSTWPSLDAGAVWARDVVDAPAEVAPRGRAAPGAGRPRAERPARPRAGRARRRRHGGHSRRRRLRPRLRPRRVQLRPEHPRAAGGRRRDPPERRGGEQPRRPGQVRPRHRPREGQGRRRPRRRAALEALHESDARMAAVAERLGTLGAAARNARAEADRTTRAISEARRALETDQAELTALAARLEEASAQPDEVEEPSTDERDRLELEASKARTHETELRLTLRTKEERARAVKGRAESLEGAARNELAARERLRQRQERRQREAGIAEAVAVAAAYAHERIATALGTAAQARDRAETGRAERDQAIHVLRQQMSVHQDELRELTDTAHRDEVARARQVARIEQLQAKAIEELGIDPEVLMEDFGPQQPIPFIAGPDHEGELPEPGSFVREEQEKRLRRAERGTVRPAGRSTRSRSRSSRRSRSGTSSSTEQLEDLKKPPSATCSTSSRRSTSASRRSSPRPTTTRRPSSSGSSRGSSPAARAGSSSPIPRTCSPRASRSRPARRARRSSGSRCSPAASARWSPSPCWSSIFKARPSPFYIMDEVEAALDDTNLGRLITLFEELRGQQPAHRHHPPEADDGDRRRALRRDDAWRRRHDGGVSQRLRDVATASA